jgi:hypothetical protein
MYCGHLVTTQGKKCQHINFKINKIDEFFYLHNDRILTYKKQRLTVIVSVFLVISSNISVCVFMTYFWEVFFQSICLLLIACVTVLCLLCL